MIRSLAVADPQTGAFRSRTSHHTLYIEAPNLLFRKTLSIVALPTPAQPHDVR